MSAPRKLSIPEDVELAAGAIGAVLAADQIGHAIESEDHQLNHAIKSAVGAAVAIGAFELLRRRDNDTHNRHDHHDHHGHDGHPSRRSRSASPQPKHHDRRLAEEILGAYALGKELLGDKKHHVAHLVAEAISGNAQLRHVKTPK